MTAIGTVYLVGAGPGAPDLLTLRAADLLRRADIVFHDALVHPDTIALAEKAEKIAVGKRCGRHSTAQRFINKRLVDAAHTHAVVVRLKGGDPLLFGRAQEEIDALEQSGIEYHFVTPRRGAGEAGHDWAHSALATDTCAIYMGAGEAEQIAATLIARGASPELPVVIVENATLPGERRIAVRLADLGAAAAQNITGPAVILLGEVYARLQSAQADAETVRRSRAA